MEILICSTNKALWKRLFSFTDKILCKKKSRYMSVSSNLLITEAMILGAAKKYKAAVIIIDVQSFPNWEVLTKEIECTYKNIKLCLVSDNMESAVTAINNFSIIYGYICKKELISMYEMILNKLYGKIQTLCGGITVTHYNSVDKIIFFDDIYYIETIKQTHLCNIVHKHGTDTIRANISSIIQELDGRFEKTRSSTIANLSEIKSINGTELIFSDNISCYCSSKQLAEITKGICQAVLI